MRSVILKAAEGDESAVILMLNDQDIEDILDGEQLHLTHENSPDIIIAAVEDCHELDTIVESGTAEELISYLDAQKPEEDYVLMERLHSYEPLTINRVPERVETIIAKRIVASVSSEPDDGDRFLAVNLIVDGMDKEVSFQVRTPEKADRLIATLSQMRHTVWP